MSRHCNSKGSLILSTIAAALVILLWSSFALAQGTTGTISGKVVDETHATIPGATVTVESPEIALKRVGTTDGEGRFTFPNLPVSFYTIKVSAKGFVEIRQENVKLDVAGNLSATYAMKVGANTEVVTVEAAAMQTVNTESASTETLIQGTQVTEIALNGRNWAQLINLAPGTAPINNDSQQGTNVRIDDTAINGLRRRSAPTIDGSANIVHGSVGSMINNVSVDAIQEFKLTSSPYSAEYGAQGGPAISVVTKRGTDKYHGSLFEFFRNDKLNAYSWESGQVTSGTPQKPRLHFNNFGGFVGGPILKDKLFFFGGVEWKLPRTGRSQNNLVPTMAMRNGDFSAYLPTSSGAVTSCSQTLSQADKDAGKFIVCDKSASTNGTPFAGNIIPLTKMSPNGLAILKNMFPEPNSGVDHNIAAPVTARDIRNDLLRLDYQASQSATFYFRWLRDTFTSDSALGNIFESQQFAIAPDHHTRVGNTMMGNWTQVLSPRDVNELAVMYQSNNQDITYQDEKQISRATYGINFVELFPENRLNKIPEVTVQGYPLVSGMGLPYTIRNNNWEVRDNYSRVVGHHTLKTGLLYTHMYNAENFRSKDAGQINFSTGSSADTTFKPQDAQNAVANLLLGAYSTYTEPQRSTLAPMAFNQWEFYLNDQWKVLPRLTLNFGVRYQYIPWPTSDLGNIVGFDPTRFDPAKAPLTTISGNTVTTDISSGLIKLIPDPTGQHTRAEGYYDPYNGLVLPGCAPSDADPNLKRLYSCRPSGLAESGTNGWAPRFGLAWDVFGNGKTAVRGGFGMFYDRTLVNPLRDASNNPPFTQVASLTNGRQYTTAATLVPTFNNPLDTVGPAVTNKGFVQALGLFAFEMKPGTVYSYSAGVQQELPWQSYIDISYVGNHGQHFTHRRDINYILPSVAMLQKTDGTFLNVNSTAGRQFNGYSNIRVQENTGISDYNSLQASFLKRVSNGFTASASYTYGFANSNFDVETSDQRVPYDGMADYSPSNFDRRHVLAFSYVYELPFLKAQKGFMGRAFGGWEVSGVTSWATGLHVNISGGSRASTSPSNGYGANVDYLGGWDDIAGGQNRFQWINKAAFVGRAGLVGNTPRNLFVMPNTQNWNLSLIKNTMVREGMKLQFRAEIFNLLNHANFRTLVTNLSASDFGRLTETDDPRTIQLGLKLRF